MRFVVNETPPGEVDVSFVLLDWSCRESFHVLDFLANQTVDRSRYEIIWIEYYRKPAEELCRRIETARSAGQPLPVDIYALMEMDSGLCYHKHLMLNLGIVLARGKIVCFCDSDAMVRPGFVQAVVEAFEEDSNIVLHMDEVRNNERSFCPFHYPSFEDVCGFGCGNWIDGRPAGLLDKADPLHSRNYGACMAAMRDDLIAIGGADMHPDYLGHICGFYEMTFRLINAHKREVWHGGEWLYHVWHPGQAGEMNILGPHDGLQVSTRALQNMDSDRVMPFVENPAIAMLRTQQAASADDKLIDALIEPAWLEQWRYSRLRTVERTSRLGQRTIRTQESADESPRPANRAARPTPLFGRRAGWRVRLWLIPLLLGMVRRQFKVKRRAAAYSSPRRSRFAPAEWLRKIAATKSFLKRILAFDRHWMRQCWLALAYAAQEGKNELVLYGEGDAAHICCALSRHLPVDVAAICPFRPDFPSRLLGRPTLREEQLLESDATIVIASFVGTPARLGRLQELGIDRDRIITLQ